MTGVKGSWVGVMGGVDEEFYGVKGKVEGVLV